MELLERHFEMALETSDGIKKLRELILSLAMQGKLVPQDPNDEPASELLKKVKAEKEKLIRDGVIKRDKPLPEITPEGIPYILPNGWEWARFQEITSVITCGLASTPKYVDKGMPFLSARNVKPYRFIPENHNFISNSDYGKLTKSCKAELDDILLTRVGAGIGEAAIIDKPIDFAFYVSLTLIKPIKSLIIPKYLLHWISSPYGVNKSLTKTFGQGVSQGNLNVNEVRKFEIPIPPLTEQKRIVAKVDQLMALCDKLEEERNERNQKRLTIHTAAMNRLLSSPNKTAFNTSWGFITNNFEELYSIPENVEDLKKAILQLAVMGKLVPQDPNDQPASELLKEIEAEKKKLVKEGKIKKQESLSPIKPEEIPYEVPKGWEWVRFFDVNFVKSELVNPNDYLDENQIAPDSIEKGSGRLLIDRTVRESGVTGPNNRFYKGQILYSKIRPSLNKAVIAPYNGLCSADMYPIETLIDPQYVLKVILSETFLEQVRKAENRIKMPKLNLESLGKFIIPIPPFNEQKRIVAKVDQLMELCNSLQQQIKGSTDKQTAILNAVLAKV